MINPINHSSNKISANNYKIEPYVMAADIYLREPHGGRGDGVGILVLLDGCIK